MSTVWSGRDGHSQQQRSGWLWSLRNAQLVVMGSNCAKKIATLLNHHQSDLALRSCCLSRNHNSSNQSPFFLNLLLSNIGVPVKIVASFAQLVFCCRSPSDLMCSAFYYYYLVVTTSELLLPCYQLRGVWLFFSERWYHKENISSLDILFTNCNITKLHVRVDLVKIKISRRTCV